MADTFNNNEQAAFFNAKAATWDAKDEHASTLQGLFAELAGVHENNCVLDIGCGTGIMFSAFIQAHARHVTALDISAEMLKQAQQKANDTFTLLNQDIYSFNTTEHFDAIVMCNVYPHFGDKAQLVHIIKRLLAPGGRFLVCHTLSKDALNAIHAQHMHEGAQHACGGHGGEGDCHKSSHANSHDTASNSNAMCGHTHEHSGASACMPRCHAHALEDIPTEIACWESDFVIDVRADTPLFYCFGGYKREQ